MSWSENISVGDWPATIQSVAGTVVIAVFVVTFLVQAFTIPSESMEQTLSLATTCWWISFATAAARVEPSAAISQCKTRRHDRLPLSDKSRAGLREARRGRARRSLASHQQTRLHQRHPGRGAVCAVHQLLRNLYRDDFPAHRLSRLRGGCKVVEGNAETGGGSPVDYPRGLLFCSG